MYDFAKRVSPALLDMNLQALSFVWLSTATTLSNRWAPLSYSSADGVVNSAALRKPKKLIQHTA